MESGIAGESGDAIGMGREKQREIDTRFERSLWLLHMDL
jgi:hypothetical protein